MTVKRLRMACLWPAICCLTNKLFPESFAFRCSQLKDLGLEVEILDDAAMEKLGGGRCLALVRKPTVTSGGDELARWRG